VTVSGLTISGANAANYTLAQPTTSANITAKELSVNGITASNKQYDAVSRVKLRSTGILMGVVDGDRVSFNTAQAIGAFANVNAGTGKVVKVSGLAITGPNAANYTLTQPITRATITAKELTVSDITANDKEYDSGTTAIIGDTANLVGAISGDDVTLNATQAEGAFADADVAEGKIVSVSGLTISGADARNYSLTQPTTSANITAKELTVNGITASHKQYDGTSKANFKSAATLEGLIKEEEVTLNTSQAIGAFANADVGTGKAVNLFGLAITGPNAANYTLTQPTTKANITAKELTVSGITSSDKEYDGATAATLKGNASLVGVIAGDDVTLNATQAAGAFTNADVAEGKIVNVSGLTISGADTGNYSLTQPTTSANITTKELTVNGITASDKEYDGTTTATLVATTTASLAGVISGDDVTLNATQAEGAFADANANAGTGKTVTVSGLTISGDDAANYTLTQPNTLASVKAKPVGHTVPEKQDPSDDTEEDMGSLISDATGNDTDDSIIDQVEIGLETTPEIILMGNGVEISDGDDSPGTDDNTDFGSVYIYQNTGAPVTFTILNIGNAPLTLNGNPIIEVSGDHRLDFNVTSNPSIAVKTGGKTTFEVAFNPSEPGMRSAVLSIANDDTNEDPYTFSISGLGKMMPAVDPLEVDPSSFTLSKLNASPPSVESGKQVTITVVVTNISKAGGSYRAELRVNGVIDTIREVMVAAGESITLNFDITRNAGSYEIDIGGQKTHFEVVNSPGSKFWWFLIALGIVLLVPSVFLLSRTRRS